MVSVVAIPEKNEPDPTDPDAGGLRKSYDGPNLIIDGLDLDIRRGELLTLLGPSGYGKTNTLMLLAGFETPSAGRSCSRRAPARVYSRTAATSAWSRTMSCFRSIYQCLRDRICFFEYPPNIVLREASLAQEFGVSRTSSRSCAAHWTWGICPPSASRAAIMWPTA